MGHGDQPCYSYLESIAEFMKWLNFGTHPQITLWKASNSDVCSAGESFPMSFNSALFWTILESSTWGLNPKKDNNTDKKFGTRKADKIWLCSFAC